MHNLSRAYRGKTHLPTTDPSIAGIDIGPLKVGARPPKASRRLSVELAALQLRILTEQPAVDRHLKREMVTALMQVHRQAYARQLRAWREEVAAFEEQMEEELQRAETKLYLLDSLRADPAPGAGGGPTQARPAHQDGVGGGGGDGNSREESMQQVRAYIQRRCPPRPIFSPVISYKLLLPVVRAAVAEQRLRDIESGTSGSRQAGAGLPPVGDAAPAPGVVAPPVGAGQGLPVADTPRDSTLASVATVELPPDPGAGAPARPRNLLMSNARARARIRRAALHRRAAAAPSHAPTGGEAGDGMTEVKASVLLGFLEHSGSGPRVDTSSPTSPSSPALSFTPSPEPQEQ
ncbi:unnamed protein product [Symbiodinium sp. KB8]|nr:unnamed protein product [Symbiodinium sp. KB8]